jgi:GPH family glycoside/pentoside/hexuronide:cation symporter
MLVIGFVINPMIEYFGGGKGGWLAAFTVLSSFILILHLISFAGTKERVKSVAMPKMQIGGLKKDIASVLKNKYWVMLVVRTFLVSMNTGMVALVYYTKYIIMDMSVLGYMFGLAMAPTILGLAVSGFVIRKFGKRHVALGGALLTVASYLGMVFVDSNIALYIGLALSSFAQAAIVSTQNSMIADTVEYGEWKTGIRTVGFSYSFFNMIQKLGQAFQAAFFGALLAFAGYLSTEGAVQPDSAITMIKTTFVYIPLVSSALQAVILCFYDLDNIYPQIISDLAERKGKELPIEA